MRMILTAATIGLAALAFGSSALAVDPPNFDFYGYTNVSTTLGGSLTLRSVLTNNGVVPTPIPLTFATHQYTLVVTGTCTFTSTPYQLYSATIQLWEDPVSGGTPANYADPASFTNGTLILSGAFDGTLRRNRFTSTLGSFIGKIDFSGGSRLGDLGTPQDWPFGGAWNRTVSGIPSGYHENWDGKIDLSPVSVEPRTWDGVKQLYR
jgi:hypothetical protein